MTGQGWGRLAAAVFWGSLVAYVLLAWLISQDTYRAAFDAVHGYRMFDIDDAYRQYLASASVSLPGVWLWNYYLPFNFVFDGVFSRLTGHSVFWMRVPHVLANVGGLWLVYRAGRHLAIHSGWLLLTLAVLLLMPLYAFLSMSFYGESLLTALMGVVIYALALGHGKCLIISAAALPFVRPEGAFYLGALTLHRLWQRHFWQAALMMLPAILYFLAILWAFDFSWGSYWQDRSAYDSLYQVLGTSDALRNEAWLPYFTINPLWWLLGLAGGFLPSMKRFRPLFAGAILMMLFWFNDMNNGNANGEARYYLSLMPLFVLSQAALLQTVVTWCQERRQRLAVGVAVLLMLFVMLENLLQLDPLRNTYFEGNRYPVGQTQSRYQQFNVLPESYAQSLKEAYAFTCAYTKYDTSVDRLVVHAFQWFNKSTLCDLASGVRVGLAFMDPQTVFRHTEGYFFTMFPELPHYAFYQFFPAPNERTRNGERYALYVTMHDAVFPGEIIQPLFANQMFSVFKVRYRESQTTPFYP